MKTIKLQKIKLTAFKGIKSLEIDFSDETQIFGANGTGKTTIFDAITWLLFGKDSSDRKDFEIKTLDNNGNAIPKIDHEVEATLDVDGDLIEIKRVYSEKWVKQRGSETATFTGHETSFFWNGVPMKQIEFNQKINGLCEESLFKLITSPLAFNSLHWEKRRDLLVQIAGEVSNDEIIGTNPAYAELIQQLAKYNSEADYQKMLKASVKKAKEEIQMIPARIDELHKSKPEPVNEKEISSQIESLNKSLSEVESQIEDSTKAYQAELDKINDFNKEKLRLGSILDNHRFDAEREAKRASSKDDSLLMELRGNVESKGREISNIQTYISDLESTIKSYEAKISNIKSEMDSKREEWYKVSAEECKDSTICPSCEQELPEAKREKIITNFKANKEQKLSNIDKYGKSLKAELEQSEKILSDNKAKLKELNADLPKIEAEHKELIQAYEAEQEKLSNITTESPETIVAKILAENEEFQNVRKQYNEMESNPPAEPKIDNEGLKTKREQIKSQMDELKAQLNNVAQIKNIDARIQELETREKELAQQIANVDRDIFTLESFTKLKVDEIEKRVRNKFSMVNFRMFKEQINGGLEPTCETLIDGVPFSSANTASKINAGIDIINTLSEFYGITAPIFIDNRESVTDLIETKAQIINLIVSPGDKKLRIQKLEKEFVC